MALLGYCWHLVWSIDHSVQRSVAGPDGKYNAYFIHLGEGEQPPYGQAVKVAVGWNPLGHMTGFYLFKGYCGSARLMWEDPRRIVLSCKPGGRVMHLVERHGDIEFQRTEAPE